MFHQLNKPTEKDTIAIFKTNLVYCKRLFKRTIYNVNSNYSGNNNIFYFGF